MKKVCFSFLILFISFQARAAFLLETTGSYLSDSIAVSTTNTSSRTFYNVGLLFTLSKGIWGGWNYMGISQSETASSVVTTYSTLDTGPSIKWFFGRGEVYSLSATYNFNSAGAYQSGTSASETWSGTSYLVAFGVNPEVSEGLHVGFSLNYFAASYSKKIVSSVESSASNTKTLVFPVFSLTKAW